MLGQESQTSKVVRRAGIGLVVLLFVYAFFYEHRRRR